MRVLRSKKYYEMQSGVVPLVKVKGKTRVVMVTSSGGKKWLVPKGHVGKRHGPAMAARQEAFEEAGVQGKITRTVGAYRYEKAGKKRTVQLYLLRVEKLLTKWPEKSLRRRRLVSLKEATRLVQDPELKRLLQTAF